MTYRVNGDEIICTPYYQGEAGGPYVCTITDDGKLYWIDGEELFRKVN